MKIRALTIDDFINNNSLLNKKNVIIQNKYIHDLIENNISSTVNLINSNGTNYDLENEKSKNEYFRHYIINVGSIIISFNNLLLDLLIHYCRKNKVFYHKSEQENYDKNLLSLEKNNKFFNLDENIIFLSEEMREFNEKSYLKKLTFNNEDKIKNILSIQMNKRKINKEYYDKEFPSWDEISLDNIKRQSYNKAIDELNIQKNQFINFIGMDKLYEIGTSNQNSINSILKFFNKHNIIPNYLFTNLQLYESLFRHQFAHGWIPFFKELLKSSEWFHIYKENENYELASPTLIDPIDVLNLTIDKFPSLDNISYDNIINYSFYFSDMENNWKNHHKIRSMLKAISYSKKGPLYQLIMPNKDGIYDNISIPNGFLNTASFGEKELCFTFNAENDLKGFSELLQFNTKSKIFDETKMDTLLKDKEELENHKKIIFNTLSTIHECLPEDLSTEIKMSQQQITLSLNNLLELIYIFAIFYADSIKN